MDTILKYVLPSLTPVTILLIALLLAPEKIEKWSALLWKALSHCGDAFKSAHKRYVKHDLQGRVNEFVRRMRRDVPGITDEKLHIEWVDPHMERSSFIENGKIVLRLKRDDPEDHNFVHGAFLFVSNSLLHKPKKYLSVSQREALDLFVCTKLIQEEKESIVSVFLDEYLHPKTVDTKSKVAVYVDDYSIIDGGGLFFSLFLQELGYLGEKVFGKRRDDLIHKEVNTLIGFLKPIATRKIGDDNDLNFTGEYCKFGLVIVGKPHKLLTSIQPYVNYIRSQLVSKSVETIYLLARKENARRIDEICNVFAELYECARKIDFARHLHYEDRKESVPQHLAILRLRGTELIHPSTNG